MAEEERIYTIPLRLEKSVPRTSRAPHAIKTIRKYVSRHMKVEADEIWMDPELSERIWQRGIQKPPSKIKVKAIKFEDGLVEVSLPEE